MGGRASDVSVNGSSSPCLDKVPLRRIWQGPWPAPRGRKLAWPEAAIKAVRGGAMGHGGGQAAHVAGRCVLDTGAGGQSGGCGGFDPPVARSGAGSDKAHGEQAAPTTLLLAMVAELAATADGWRRGVECGSAPVVGGGGGRQRKRWLHDTTVGEAEGMEAVTVRPA
uniref:DUF834 domain-containing protein n=2 Tax=Oryza TaxID=4527 RepID=A0A0D3HRA6_9ORYZ